MADGAIKFSNGDHGPANEASDVRPQGGRMISRKSREATGCRPQTIDHSGGPWGRPMFSSGLPQADKKKKKKLYFTFQEFIIITSFCPRLRPRGLQEKKHFDQILKDGTCTYLFEISIISPKQERCPIVNRLIYCQDDLHLHSKKSYQIGKSHPSIYTHGPPLQIPQYNQNTWIDRFGGISPQATAQLFLVLSWIYLPILFPLSIA